MKLYNATKYVIASSIIIFNKSYFTLKRNPIYIYFVFIFSLASFSQEKPLFEKIDTLDVLLRTSEKLRVANDMYASLEYAFKVVNYAQDLGHNHYLSHGYLLMGTVQYEIIDYENATKNFLKSLEYTEKTKNKVLLPYVLNSLANVYYDGNKDYENALKYYKRAVKLGKGNPHIQQYQIPLHNLIWTYMDLDRFDEAAIYLREADSIDSSIPDSVQTDRSSLYLLRARNYAQNNDIIRAEENFDKSFEYLKDETYWPKGKSYFYRYRSEMYEKIGDHTKAINDLKLLNENDQKVFENARSKTDETTKMRFKVDQYEQQLAIAKREKDLLLDIDKNNKKIIFISTTALLLLAGIVFFYYRGYRSKKKISEILEFKNIELSEAKSQAEQLSKIKSQFISTISHELRTPLYGVVGISSILLENDAKSEKDKKLLNSLKFSADYLLDLVNKVLKVSKIDSEEKELIKTPTDLFSLSQNILQSFEYQSHKKNNILILDHNHSIPKLLYIDALRISEVLINLIGNAIKFTHQGKIWLRVKLLSTDDKTVTIRLEVEDTGTGIPEDQKDYIFEEFSQVGSVYDNKQGTGLGLSIVKNLVQVMGSQIYFESKKNIGSLFYFDLELDIAESLNDLNNQSENKESTTNISAKILVAEDNKINQLVTKNLLKNIGCSCIMAENGIDAVQILKKESFDLILMDINMPIMDGVQATIEIRQFDTTTPIIALTASELSEVSDECKKAGMNDLINKPLNKEDLRNCIAKHHK
ncbi:response regulator [Aquimarina sp. AD1]|uniref:tetratricopeptide repeat-containing hybrid sensor histidine kinase/response regulator n=2 Tax=Aquimarina sp. (strain AD1) TaxID=1714848 RepID=UPI000E4A0FE5|nr:response regulator [Aquimarina sp. AD1]AXT57566.1 response regulator [Aquimarina sp. AD1]